MRLTIAVHAFAQADIAQEFCGAGLEDTRANPLQHVLAGLALEHDALDAVLVEHVREEQSRWTAPDDCHLRSHDRLLLHNR